MAEQKTFNRWLVVVGAMTGVLGVAMVIIARPLLFASISPEVAEARGVPVRALAIAFLVLLALVVAMATQVVGTLLLFALVVTPAAAALALTARPVVVVAGETAIALGSVWGGLGILSLIHISEPTRLQSNSYAVFRL